jgi:hypothetical protein
MNNPAKKNLLIQIATPSSSGSLSAEQAGFGEELG